MHTQVHTDVLDLFVKVDSLDSAHDVPATDFPKALYYTRSGVKNVYQSLLLDQCPQEGQRTVFKRTIRTAVGKELAESFSSSKSTRSANRHTQDEWDLILDREFISSATHELGAT